MNKSNAKHLKSKDKIESINALVSFSLANKLFDKQPDGSFEIEKYNTKSLEKAVQRTTNASGLFDYISKHGNEKGILKLVNENALMKKINSKYTLLDYVLSNQIIPYVLTDGKGSLLFAEFLRERGLYKYLVHFKTEILLHKFYGNKTLLDELNERGYNNKIKTNVTKEDELIKLIESSNLSTINHISNRILLSPAKNIFKKDSFGNETVLEHLVDTGYDSFLNNIDSFNEEIIITLCLRCYYKLLGDKVSMRKLINTKIKGRSVLDFILKSGTSFEKEINSLSLAQKVLNSGRIDLLVNCSPKILYEYATLNETYLEYLLDAVKSNKVRCNLKKIRLLHTGKINDLVNFYMALAQKDLCDYVNPLNEKDLLTKKNGKRLIDELLRVNRNLTIDKILTHKVKTSPKIAAILKSKGIVQKGIQLPVIRNDYSGDDLDKIRKEINNLQIPEEGEKLLFDLEQAFLTGEKSSYDLIQALICGYRRALYVDYNHSAQEIKKLIEIKINNPEFAYRMRSGRSCFRSGSKTIFCENNNITILMHETGHALHYFLTDFKEPNEFEEIVKNVRENPDTIKKVDLFYKNIGEIKKKIGDSVKDKMNEYFSQEYFQTNEESIKKHIRFLKDNYRNELIKLGLSKKVIEQFLAENFTPKEYIHTQKRIFYEECKSDIYISQYATLNAISDILDAVFLGKLNSKKVKNMYGETILYATGHGIAYYSSNMHGFDEMLANFSIIVKSPNASASLNYLRSLIGDELFDTLSDFYYNNILEEKEVSHSLGGR